MLEIRVIPTKFDGTAKLCEMYTGKIDLLSPVEKKNDVFTKVIPEEDLELVEYLKTGKEPQLIDLCSF